MINKLTPVSYTHLDVYKRQPQYKDSFYINSLFVSTPVREAVNSERGDFVPIFLSEIPLLFKNGILPLDVAIVTCLLYTSRCV